MNDERGAVAGIFCLEGFYTMADLEQYVQGGGAVKLKVFCGPNPVLVVTKNQKEEEIPF